MIKRLTAFLAVCAVCFAAVQICSCSQDNNGNWTIDSGEDDGGQNPSQSSEEPVLCTDIGQTPIVLAYYTENSPELPDVSMLTHINYAHGRFADPKNGTGGIVISKPDLMEKVIALKAQNPKLKVMLMVGGWGKKADGFSMMARSLEKRKEFCNSIKSHLDNYGLDGIDIDWEYPTYPAEGNGAIAADTQNFNLLLKELRQTIGTSKIISFASSSDAKYVDWKTAMLYLDYVNVMTYDMGSAPRHNSPLYRSSTFNQSSDDESIKQHYANGVPYNRQVFGVPFYGRSEKNTDDYPEEVNYNQMADVFKGTLRKDGKTYDLTGKNIRQWDKSAKVPYLTDESGEHIYLCYDDSSSVAEKGRYVLKTKLLGAMFWEYRHDDGNHTLLKSLVNSIYGKESVINQ